MSIGQSERHPFLLTVVVFWSLGVTASCGADAGTGAGGGSASSPTSGASTGSGGGGGYCATVDPSRAQCPPGSAKRECACLDGSEPCFGLDELRCNELAATAQNSQGFCSPIYGYSDQSGTSPLIYIGCHTYDPDGSYYTADWCTHPANDRSFCDWANSSEIPDGWVECTYQCECPSMLAPSDCPAGSDDPECCCNFPNSNPCEGLDEGRCTVVNEGLCHPVKGASLADPGNQIYLGCRSQCVPEMPHGSPTCVHPPTDAVNCDLAEDERIPDGWSTDCSACNPPP